MGRFLGFVRSGIDAGRDLSQTMSSLVVALKYEDRVKQDRIEWRAYHYMRSNIGAKIFYALSASHRLDVVEQPIVLAFCEASLHSMFVCVFFFSLSLKLLQKVLKLTNKRVVPTFSFRLHPKLGDESFPALEENALKIRTQQIGYRIPCCISCYARWVFLLFFC